MTYKTLLYYKFIELEKPQELVTLQKQLCEMLGLKGRILIGTQGINGTLEGSEEQVQKYMQKTHEYKGLEDLLFKISDSKGDGFKKMSIKLRKEIVTTGLENFAEFGPHKNNTGKYLASEELHEWFNDPNKEFYMVDMRNDYENNVGHFERSIFPQSLLHFRYLKQAAEELSSLKDKTIVTYCTGGIRCEIASGYLKSVGFKDVYQLQDGIVTYMEKYPNQHFKGKLYVFDQRMMMGFNTESPDHEVVGKCIKCSKKSENLINYTENNQRRHNVVCENCIAHGLVKLQEELA